MLYGFLSCVTKFVNHRMLVHVKGNSCDILSREDIVRCVNVICMSFFRISYDMHRLFCSFHRNSFVLGFSVHFAFNNLTIVNLCHKV